MNRKILLVEDDENDVFFMERALKGAGIHNPVDVVSDGSAAIKYFEKVVDGHLSRLNLIPCVTLLDLKLPHVMGLDVLKWIRTRSELQSMVVLILSSSNLITDIRMAYQLGANSYLVKPSSPDLLVVMMARVKQFWFPETPAPQPAAVQHLAPVATALVSHRCD